MLWPWRSAVLASMALRFWEEELRVVNFIAVHSVTVV